MAIQEKGGEYSLTGELGTKTGYIKLPKFYVDFYNKTTDAAEDVSGNHQAQGQGVDGIILDLRSNGGGSLQAATEIAGLFLKKGLRYR